MKARENPFRAEKVITLEFQPQSTSMEQLWLNIASMGWHGALVGPCGTGKTTLLETVKLRLESEGKTVIFLRFDAKQQRLQLPEVRGETALLVDGVEQLSRIDSWRLARFGRRFPVFIVTSHRSTFLPVWILTETSPLLLQHLCARLEVEITPDRATFLWKKHGGNLRFALGELYDEQILQKNSLTN